MSTTTAIFDQIETITPKHERILAEIARRGLKVEHRSKCIRVYGQGIEVLAVRLEEISKADLRP